MWDMLIIDDENAGTTHRTPEKINHAQLLRREKMWRSQDHYLEREKITSEQMHNDEIARQKRKYESIIATVAAKKDETINEQKKIIDELEEQLKQLREELKKNQE